MPLPPMIGIVTWGSRNRMQPFGRWSSTMAQTIQALRKRKIHAVGIAIEDLYRLSQKKNCRPIIRTWRPLRGTWYVRYEALPSIFYNRILSRRREQSPQGQATLRWLQDTGRIVFNPGYLSKASVYEMLCASPVGSYLPKTEIAPLDGRLNEYLEQWPSIYMKPLNSCQGRGIYKLSNHNSHWQVTGLAPKRIVRRAFASQAMMRSWLEKRLRHRRYLLQQGIELGRLHDRPYDLRVLAQKNGHGEWVFVGCGIRLAAPGHVVTHRPNGGSVVSTDQVMNRRFGREGWQAKRKELSSMAVEAARELEKQHGGVFGIVTMDIACDRPDGRLWILEINAKPGPFDEPRIQKESYDLLADYMRFLAARRGCQ
ncbi:YheC/YheD family protein [Heliophilum fasciatum]|uniref:YheC/D-like protein n=1 Tax=Heliophilum fasciatum TaxID=35700 RepID=A0A4R2RC94_9FIRM|nr:YheC/YheD family protein [Heliophilum fasciatum]MCW2279201.1 hypothetical protein [Heliophilum fasciatum]TCP60990.1 YheC/D-like protein [Heliophilum fasciatum]